MADILKFPGSAAPEITPAPEASPSAKVSPLALTPCQQVLAQLVDQSDDMKIITAIYIRADGTLEWESSAADLGEAAWTALALQRVIMDMSLGRN